MATVVERSTSAGEKRRYVVFWARDRANPATKKKVWVKCPTALIDDEGKPRTFGKKDADKKVREIESLLDASGGLWPAEEPPEQAVTFAAYRETWMADRARKVSDRQLDNDRAVFRLYLAPRFDAMPLGEIRRPDVKQLVGELVDAGLARNSIRNIVSPLRTMLREAVRDDKIETNPAADIEIPDSAPVRAASVPTRAELDKILAAASVDARDAITLMAALGLRRGECFALRYADVDFKETLVHVRATNHRGQIADRTKTKAGTRLVPLFPSAKAALEARKRRLDVEPHPTAFIFANAIGGPLNPDDWYRLEWRPALKTAGLEKKFHIHELRHYAATTLDEQGMVGKLRTEIVGHANEAITNSIYTHVRRERVAAVAAAYDPLGEASSG